MRFLLALLLLIPTVAVSQQRQRIGDFWVIRDVDPITDEASVVAITAETDSPSSLRAGSIGWICVGDVLQVLLSADTYLAQQRLVKIQWRFDDSPVVEEGWMPSADGTSIAPEHLQTMVLFTDQAKEARRLAVRTYDFNGSSYTFLFSMNGVSRSLQQLPCVEENLAPVRRLMKGNS